LRNAFLFLFCCLRFPFLFSSSSCARTNLLNGAWSARPASFLFFFRQTLLYQQVTLKLDKLPGFSFWWFPSFFSEEDEARLTFPLSSFFFLGTRLNLMADRMETTFLPSLHRCFFSPHGQTEGGVRAAALFPPFFPETLIGHCRPCSGPFFFSFSPTFCFLLSPTGSRRTLPPSLSSRPGVMRRRRDLLPSLFFRVFSPPSANADGAKNPFFLSPSFCVQRPARDERWIVVGPFHSPRSAPTSSVNRTFFPLSSN